MTSTTVPITDTRRSWWPAAYGVLAALYAVLVGVASFGVPSLLTAWWTGGDELELRTAYVHWGVLAGLFVPAAAIALVRRPLVAAGSMLVALLVAITVGVGLAFGPENASYAALMGVPALLLVALHPRRDELWRAGSAGPDRLLLALAGAAAGPVAVFAVDLARHSAALPESHTMHGQYAQGAILALALLGGVVVGALRQRGWWLAVAVTAAGAALLGLAGLLFPHDLMSLGTGWGAAALTWSAAVVAAALRSTRR